VGNPRAVGVGYGCNGGRTYPDGSAAGLSASGSSIVAMLAAINRNPGLDPNGDKPTTAVCDCACEREGTDAVRRLSLQGTWTFTMRGQRLCYTPRGNDCRAYALPTGSGLPASSASGTGWISGFAQIFGFTP